MQVLTHKILAAAATQPKRNWGPGSRPIMHCQRKHRPSGLEECLGPGHLGICRADGTPFDAEQANRFRYRA